MTVATGARAPGVVLATAEPSEGHPVSGRLVLSARGITKTFPGVRALSGVDLALVAGEVHGLVGENGAGKSTLVKVLSGSVTPDAGSISVLGRRLDRFDPRTARRAGIAVIHQEPHVVPALSPVANVFLGQPVATGGFLHEGAMRRRFLALADELGVVVPPSGPAGALPVAAQQAIEIMRTLVQEARIVLMDEPTASLGAEERAGLFRMIDVLLRRGTAVVYISHKLEDVLRIARTVTVLRDGERVLSVPAEQADVGLLVQAMLDGELRGVLERTARVAPANGAEALRVEGLSVPGVLWGIDLSVAAGEIVGIAGLVGAGRSTLLRAIGGAEPSAEGLMAVGGAPIPWPRSPRQAHRRGIVLAPEDRRTEGLVMSMPSWENLALPSLPALGRAGFHRRRTVFAAAAQEAAKVDFSPGRLRATAGNLSGGNQQKLVLGKLLPLRPKVLLVDEPTRGIDVGAKAEIFTLLQRLAAAGTAVVIVSEEIEELIVVADRIVVVREGRTSGTVGGARIDPEEVLRAMLPHSSAATGEGT